MYILPQKYKCKKCGFEFMWSPHDRSFYPVTMDEEPVCPKCWSEFLKGFVAEAVE
jgi:DNA-directed RNA polymerase subunit RPC12/RpoP